MASSSFCNPSPLLRRVTFPRGRTPLQDAQHLTPAQSVHLLWCHLFAEPTAYGSYGHCDLVLQVGIGDQQRFMSNPCIRLHRVMAPRRTRKAQPRRLNAIIKIAPILLTHPMSNEPVGSRFHEQCHGRICQHTLTQYFTPTRNLFPSPWNRPWFATFAALIHPRAPCS